MCSNEQPPQVPPEATIRFGKDTSLEVRKTFRVVPYVATTLLDCSKQLVQMSRTCEGRFREGMDISVSCRAASVGAITTGCAAFEAYLNEDLFNAAGLAKEHGMPEKERLLGLAMKLTPRDRLDALASSYGEPIDWGGEPYQSLDIILSIRKHLLHHEILPYSAIEGHWPAKKLRDLQKRIKSPYPDALNLNWDQHALTPAGAEWVVRVIEDICQRMEEWWGTKRSADSTSQCII